MLKSAMRLILSGAAALASAAISTAVAQGSGEIEWRLENPFRYFKESADTDLFRTEFAALTDEERRTPILSLERRLAQKTGGWGWAERFFEPRAGFSAKTYEDVCWQQAKGCSDYVKPKNHKVLVRLNGFTAPCEWRVEGSGFVQSSDCSREQKLEIPFPAGARVEVKFGDQVRTLDIKVNDILVVGMGDSFASGEGNPDRAVRFDPRLVTNYGDRRLNGFPARAALKIRGNQIVFPTNPKYADARARWLNEPCHRSLYSHHLRAALQLALDDPKSQTSVTYLSVACTGSAIFDGLFKAWKGTVDTRGSEAIAQISGISNAICGTTATAVKPWPLPENKPFGNIKTVNLRQCPQEEARKIDYLFLSIGGNDIGFSSLVANAALRLDPGTAALAPLFGGGNLRIGVEQASQNAQSLPAKYKALAAALRDVLHMTKPGNVFLTAYPQMDFDENGQPCGNSTRGMDVSNLYALNGDKAARLENFLEEQLTPIMKEAAAETGWTFVEAHRREAWFRNRGVCAYSAGERENAELGAAQFPRHIAPTATVSAFAESSAAAPRLPRGTASISQPAGYGLIQTAPAAAEWKPFAPDQFRPYVSRQRFFRTPNDAFLTAHHSDLKKLGGMEALTRFSAYSGAFHPTAEGQAAIADALFMDVKKKAAPESQETAPKPG